MRHHSYFYHHQADVELKTLAHLNEHFMVKFQLTPTKTRVENKVNCSLVTKMKSVFGTYGNSKIIIGPVNESGIYSMLVL